MSCDVMTFASTCLDHKLHGLHSVGTSTTCRAAALQKHRTAIYVHIENVRQHLIMCGLRLKDQQQLYAGDVKTLR